MTHHQHRSTQQDQNRVVSPLARPVPGSGQRLREHVAAAREVRALRLDTTGALTAISYKGRPHHALRAPLGVRSQDAPGGVGLEALDDDLTMWFDEYGAEHQPVNPAASVVAAAFGRHEQVYGPVVFTGWVETGGLLGGWTCDISAAATVLLAGIAASTDTPELPGGAARSGRVERSREWSGLGIEITRGGWRDSGAESFDALAWTITRDGDVPRCMECGEPGSHEEHQPEVLAERAGQDGPEGQQDGRIRVAG